MAGSGRRPAAVARPGNGRVWPAVGTLVVLVVGVRLLVLTAPVAADEAGFLMVGGQWAPGASLYGDYWVGRPPGLIWLFAVAADLGGQVPLRLMGAAAASAAVAAAGLIGREVAPSRPRAAVWCAALAACLVSTPLVGMAEVDGEILALPFLMTGLWMVLRAADGRRDGTRARWALGAGAAAAAAASVKPNLLDVFVVALALGAALTLRRRPRAAAVLLSAFAAGALAVAALLSVVARARGTGLGDLWDALVVFRGQVSHAMATQGSESSQGRALHLVLSLVYTGAPAVLLLLARLQWRGARGSSAGAAMSGVVLALLTWEAVGIAAGGGYWLHYLIGLVPGLVLLLAVSLARPVPPGVRRSSARRSWSRHPHAWAMAPVAVSTLVGLVVLAVHPPTRPPEEQAVIDYLDAHRSQGRTAVVGFGNPALLEPAGMTSPYPDLWSLPVRVHDPDLRGFDNLLRGPEHPHWVVVRGTSLGSWGIDASTADQVLASLYRPVFASGDYYVFERTG